MRKKWEIVHEADTDDGKPTQWALEIDHEFYGKYVWISGLLHDKDNIVRYDVEVKSRLGSMILAECKTLASAKRWVTTHLLKK